MAAVRVTDADVKGVVETEKDTTPFIDTAHIIVDEHLLSTDLSSVILTKIELYLSAHFVVLTEERGGLLRSSLGESAETYSDIYGEGFRATRFGQQALALDTTGVLASLSSIGVKAEFEVI